MAVWPAWSAAPWDPPQALAAGRARACRARHCRLPGEDPQDDKSEQGTVDMWDQKWDTPIMKAGTIDDKRRIVLPKECPPGSKITIEEVDPFTWIVRLQPS